jgi:hypothetical protein
LSPIYAGPLISLHGLPKVSLRPYGAPLYLQSRTRQRAKPEAAFAWSPGYAANSSSNAFASFNCQFLRPAVHRLTRVGSKVLFAEFTQAVRSSCYSVDGFERGTALALCSYSTSIVYASSRSNGRFWRPPVCSRSLSISCSLTMLTLTRLSSYHCRYCFLTSDVVRPLNLMVSILAMSSP